MIHNFHSSQKLTCQALNSHTSRYPNWSRIKCSVGCKRGDIRPVFSSVTKCLNTDKCIQLSCTPAVDGKYFLRETTAPPATFIHVPLVRRIVYPSGCVLLHPSHLQPSNTRNSLPWSVVLVVQLQIRQFRTLCNYPYMCSFILPSQDRKHFSDHPIPKIIPFYPLSILSEIDWHHYLTVSIELPMIELADFFVSHEEHFHPTDFADLNAKSNLTTFQSNWTRKVCVSRVHPIWSVSQAAFVVRKTQKNRWTFVANSEWCTDTGRTQFSN